MLGTNILNDNYNLKNSVNKLTRIDDYPHLMIGRTDEARVIVKELNFNEKKIEFLENVYTEIACISNVNIPLINRKGKYILENDKVAIVLFEELELPKEYPSARWWAAVLSELHLISVFWQQKEIRLIDSLNEVNNLFLESQQYMKSNVRNILKQMLRCITWDKKYAVKMVFNHGDPLNSNVLKKEGDFKLIDFESACIAPKEYDIQRQLWDFAINCDTFDALKEYWNAFKCEYELRNQQSVINVELLYDLYIIDFCKTMCWLCLVSADDKRIDCERQQAVCNLFMAALRSGKIQKMLSCIDEKRG